MASSNKMGQKQQHIAEAMVADYADNMFADGHNRTETDARAHNAPRYDKAAHTIDPELDPIQDATFGQAASEHTAHSRDGSDASGELDEWGGSLGGTEKQIDDLEATGAPVDRTPLMKG